MIRFCRNSGRPRDKFFIRAPKYMEIHLANDLISLKDPGYLEGFKRGIAWHVECSPTRTIPLENARVFTPSKL